MKVVFIPHALERMKERGIPEELVIEILNFPEKVSTGYFGRKIAQKKLNGKIVRVVYEEGGNEIVVITVYITSKLNKYGGRNNEDFI